MDVVVALLPAAVDGGCAPADLAEAYMSCGHADALWEKSDGPLTTLAAFTPPRTLGCTSSGSRHLITRRTCILRNPVPSSVFQANGPA